MKKFVLCVVVILLTACTAINMSNQLVPNCQHYIDILEKNIIQSSLSNVELIKFKQNKNKLSQLPKQEQNKVCLLRMAIVQRDGN